MKVKIINNIVYARPEVWNDILKQYKGNEIDFDWIARCDPNDDVGVGGLSGWSIDHIKQIAGIE